MTVRDIYLSTNESEAIEIADGKRSLYIGCCSDIPYEFLNMIVYRITHNKEALILFIQKGLVIMKLRELVLANERWYCDTSLLVIGTFF